MSACFFRPITITIVSLVLLPGWGGRSLAQDTLTFAGYQAVLGNSEWVTTTIEYFPEPSVDLGLVSPLRQTFDFSSVPNEDSRDSAMLVFRDPAGEPGATDFPAATLCSPEVFHPDDSSEITRVGFFLLREDGLYALGNYIRQTLSTIFDTTIVERFTPMRLLLPLPLQVGTGRTGVDTLVMDATNDDYAVTVTTVDCDGWGDLSTPFHAGIDVRAGTSAVTCLRLTRTETMRWYFSGTFAGSENSTSVEYLSQDGTHLVVRQSDSGYSEGVAPVTSISSTVRLGPTAAGAGPGALPVEAALRQNYPNPFNPSTTITFSLPEAGPVKLEVFDLLGRRVGLVVDGVMPPGTHAVPFDAADLAGGMYLCRLRAGEKVFIKKMSVVR